MTGSGATAERRSVVTWAVLLLAAVLHANLRVPDKKYAGNLAHIAEVPAIGERVNATGGPSLLLLGQRRWVNALAHLYLVLMRVAFPPLTQQIFIYFDF